MFDTFCRLQIINIFLGSDDNPQLIFESLNSTGMNTYELPCPEVAFVNGKELTLNRQGSYFLIPTDDAYEDISIEVFEAALIAGQVMLLTRINPWWSIPVAVASAALIAARVAMTTVTLKAATILIAASKQVTARTVHVVMSSWPIIEAALIRAGIAVTWWAVASVTYAWLQGNCISSGRRTRDGHFGDVFVACVLKSLVSSLWIASKNQLQNL